MFRGLRRLFRFRLRVSNLRVVEVPQKYGPSEFRTVGDWKIVYQNNEASSVGHGPLIGMTKHEARKAYRWWRKYGD